MTNIYEKASKIKLVIFDVDGVLTDGSLYFGHDGREYKVFHSRDGHGMKMLRQSGVEIGVITARSSQAVAHRMANLGLEHVYQGQQEKLPAYENLKDKLGLSENEIAYVGDDVIDLPIMTRVGFAVAVADAHSEVAKRADWQTSLPGGRGAAREACEFIMKARGNYDEMLATYVA